MITKAGQHKLSHRAEDLLLLIDEGTEHDDAQVLARYFVPSSRLYYPKWSKDAIRITGSSDARILRSLAVKGLTTKPENSPHEFGYAITEDGRLVAEEIRMNRGLQELK